MTDSEEFSLISDETEGEVLTMSGLRVEPIVDPRGKQKKRVLSLGPQAKLSFSYHKS